MREKTLYEFGEFRVDAVERVLQRNGVPVALPPKAFETLLVLVERRGSIVTREELLAAVWPDVFVEENNLTQYISLLRRTLRPRLPRRRWDHALGDGVSGGSGRLRRWLAGWRR
jgi:DNA-binding winged helix-turn-helix (wHTH) protein